MAGGARDLSRRNVSTAKTRPQNSKASFARQHSCGLKSALRRSSGDHAKHIRRARCRHHASPRSTRTDSTPAEDQLAIEIGIQHLRAFNLIFGAQEKIGV